MGSWKHRITLYFEVLEQFMVLFIVNLKVWVLGFDDLSLDVERNWNPSSTNGVSVQSGAR